MMILVSRAKKELGEAHKVTLLGKDIVSAFNNVRREPLLARMEQEDLINEHKYCQQFLRSRTFTISWDSEVRGQVTMADGAP